MRSEVAVLAGIAARILPTDRFDWTSLTGHDALREAMAECVPGYEPVRAIGATHREFTIPGRVMHRPAFPTADGLAHFHAVALPEPRDDGDFMMMTIRSEGQFNTVVYDEEDLYRGNVTRDVVMMSAEDAGRLGLAEGDPVDVVSATGSMRARTAIVDIRSGNVAMYYPEANVLVDRRLDAESRTPAFKSVPVTIRPA